MIGLGAVVAFLLVFVTFVGVPAFVVGWKRPPFSIQTKQRIVLISVLIFSFFVGMSPLIQRDNFTLIGGVMVVGVGGGLLGFVLTVKAAELLRHRFPWSENFPGLAERARKY